MSPKIKNRVLYWTLAILPLGAVYLFGRGVNDSVFFFFFFCVYFLWYRPLLDMRRLLSLGIIEEKDAWRFFVPFAIDRTRYIKALWLG